MRTRLARAILAAIVVLMVAGCNGQGSVTIISAIPTPPESPLPLPSLFDGEAALDHIRAQMALGPRPTGSVESRRAGDYIASQLRAFGWEVSEQEFEYLGTIARNIMGMRGEGPLIILGAHYDTRRRADRDAHDPTQPVPGANDGASGVAVLLELARTLDADATGYRLQLAFFDAEDNGGLDGWDWIAGSRYMANTLTVTPKMMCSWT